MEITDYSTLFIDGRKVQTEYGDATLKMHQTGELIMPSGKIVACDAFITHTSPFRTKVLSNSYPVILSIAHFGNTDQRVAAAMLQLSSSKPVRWEMALNTEQDLSLGEDEIFGYPVDSGTGCFMDAEAAQIVMESDSYSDALMSELDKTYVDTWSWANLPLEPLSKANIIAFSTGLGDGVYASFFGIDEKGNVTGLITDFILFDS